MRFSSYFFSLIAPVLTLVSVGDVVAQGKEEIPKNPSVQISQALGERILKLGTFGSDVRELQERLRELGYYGGEIGEDYNSSTEAAVIRFQTNKGLQVDGIAGPNTLEALVNHGEVPYVVVIPGSNQELEARVNETLQTPPEAFLADSRRGKYVHAGAFQNRAMAESRSYFLRAQGFDARVAYKP
ncbi:MAG: peptidoglycan-binding protein [Okeania sp. SIO2D1]|nr:peptidoglycan-binding protein [Okeania sp. SIO2D1]